MARWIINIGHGRSRARFFRYRTEAQSAETAISRAVNALGTIWTVASGRPAPPLSVLRTSATRDSGRRSANRAFLIIFPAMRKMFGPTRLATHSPEEARDMVQALMMRDPNDTLLDTVGAFAGIESTWASALRPENGRFKECHVSWARSPDLTVPSVYMETALMISFAASLDGQWLSFRITPPVIASATLRAAAQAGFNAKCLPLRAKALDFLRRNDGEWLAADVEACLSRRSRR